jgi:hypothetical protein
LQEPAQRVAQRVWHEYFSRCRREVKDGAVHIEQDGGLAQLGRQTRQRICHEHFPTSCAAILSTASGFLDCHPKEERKPSMTQAVH